MWATAHAAYPMREEEAREGGLEFRPPLLEAWDEAGLDQDESERCDYAHIHRDKQDVRLEVRVRNLAGKRIFWKYGIRANIGTYNCVWQWIWNRFIPMHLPRLHEHHHVSLHIDDEQGASRSFNQFILDDLLPKWNELQPPYLVRMFLVVQPKSYCPIPCPKGATNGCVFYEECRFHLPRQFFSMRWQAAQYTPGTLWKSHQLPWNKAMRAHMIHCMQSLAACHTFVDGQRQKWCKLSAVRDAMAPFCFQLWYLIHLIDRHSPWSYSEPLFMLWPDVHENWVQESDRYWVCHNRKANRRQFKAEYAASLQSVSQSLSEVSEDGHSSSLEIC